MPAYDQVEWWLSAMIMNMGSLGTQLKLNFILHLHLKLQY